MAIRNEARLWALAMVVLLSGACGKSAPLNPRPHPCVFDSDCDEGLSCVNEQCVFADRLDAGRQRGPKQFGEPCAASKECQSGFCLGGPRGSFCSVECDEAVACPAGFSCKVVPDPSAIELDADAGAPEEVTLCALPQPLLCQPCERDTDCGASGGDHCLPSGIYGFCGQDCTFDSCPQGYTCADTPRGLQCQPVDETCDCKPSTAGRFRGCANENDAGSCYGAQVCTADAGWGECQARTALTEDCNGFDDDCDGIADNHLPGRECLRTSAFGTCKGPQTCQGAGGWRCDAPTPVAESCNYVDDDCDGVADQSFVDGQGRYVQADHCGGCGNSCSALIDHSAKTSCELDPAGAPRCQVQACKPGYFPSPDGRQCLQLADSLCRSCTQDEDCVGPGSRCVELNGEKVCGRDCGPSSAYPSCPGGYACQSTPSGQQCLPGNGSCECNAAQIGTIRSCEVSTALKTCSGYQTCATSSGGPQWSTCDVASFNPEICDGQDNDCNGTVDDGFRNPWTQQYDTVGDCGFCNNDCSKYWSPTLQHTHGVCDASGFAPVCRMGACTTERVGGIDYEWRDVNGDTQDGCECRRVQGNTAVDYPQEGPPFTDENCDGIDGVISDALFVWAGAPGGGNGTLASPHQTIGQALAALPSSGKKYVLVAEGTYAENVPVTANVRLYGGYSRDFHKRDPVLYASTIRGVMPSGSAPPAAVWIHDVLAGGQSAVVAAFTIRGVDQSAATPDDQDGRPSYAVLLENAFSGARLMNNELLAGKGGKGGRGGTGLQGFGRQASAVLDGQSGLDNLPVAFGPCPATQSRAGGRAGVNSQCAGSFGVSGGGVLCPVFNWLTTTGNQAPYFAGSGLNGEGGHDWSYDSSSSVSCSHVTESGFPSNIQTHDGHDGEAGADGTSGTGGQGAPARGRLGSIVAHRWVPSPFDSSGGSQGTRAQGGGGGGAGGGTAWFPGGGCNRFEMGATGGGGGAGGCGGSGGRPGRSGGASISLFLTFSSTPAASALPVISGNRIERNLGGDGGNGGFGGAGGQGGAGGFGGSTTTWSGSIAGKGGDGGNGGAGGGGGGGAGGPSFGILGFRVNPSAWGSQNTFVTAAGASTGGKGGTGGSSSGAAATGTAGTDGASANLQALLPCSGGCPAGASCDANGICSAP